MNRRLLTIIGLAAAAALPLPAFSQSYVGASLGSADAKDICSDDVNCDKTSTGWRIFGGHRFTRNFGVELGYVDLGHVTAGDAGSSVKVENRAFEALALLVYPVNKVSIFGKVGGYYARTRLSGAGAENGTENTGGLTFGAGAQYDFTPNLGLRGDWQHYAKVGGNDTGGTADINLFMVGLVWTFR